LWFRSSEGFLRPSTVDWMMAHLIVVGLINLKA
jgi:hypothetical protein